jgi:hypothetical protein
MAMSALNAGAAEVCPNNDCSLRSVTINITYNNGEQRTIHGLIQPGILPDGFNQTWTGRGAAGAASAWNAGVLSGGGFQGGVQSLIDNWIDLDRPADSRRFAHAPQNPAQTQTPCEQKLAGIFGGNGAIMRTRYDADGNYRGRDPELAARVAGNSAQMGTPAFDAEHLYNFPHLSGNLAGTQNSGVYVPSGYDPKSVTAPTPGDHIVTFYYPSVDFTLAIFHVNNFGINPNDRNGAGSIRIGTTGGPGGTSADIDPARPNLHSHFEIWNGRTGYLPPGDARNAARVPFTFVYCP